MVARGSRRLDIHISWRGALLGAVVVAGALAPGGLGAAEQGAPCAGRGGASSLLMQATFYHGSLQSQAMANGRPYDARNLLLAASNRFRLGTVLRVRRLDGGGDVLVEITDRGSGAVDLDLSEAGFARLASLDEGRVAVCVEAIN